MNAVPIVTNVIVMLYVLTPLVVINAHANPDILEMDSLVQVCLISLRLSILLLYVKLLHCTCSVGLI